MAAAVEVSSLVRKFGTRAAVDGIDLTLDGGDCLAVFGPNGAGKTTLLRLLAGLLKPTSGDVRLNGVNVRHDTAARARVGIISHHSMLYAPLTVRENLTFTARLYGLDHPAAAVSESMSRLGIADRADTPVRTLSRGLQQRVSIARAVVHQPGVVLLDEPYSGLDESGAAALTSLLRGLKSAGASLVIVTHNVAEGLALATHAAIMSAGRFARFERQRDVSFDAQQYASEYRALVGAGQHG
jgi:heme exporter protein A